MNMVGFIAFLNETDFTVTVDQPMKLHITAVFRSHEISLFVELESKDEATHLHNAFPDKFDTSLIVPANKKI
jgi:hypothetical protein